MRTLRDTVVLAKIETTYGTDAVPAGATDALLVSDVTINPLVSQNVSRDLVRGYLGGSDQLVGPAYVEVSFSVEFVGSGTAVTAPAWGKLLKACGMVETTQTASVDYTPDPTPTDSLSIYYYLSGQLHKLLGARGTFTLAAGVGERPLLKFRFVGKDGGLTAVTNATPTLTAWKTPLVVTDTNSTDMLFGALTYTAATGVISGGTPYTSKGLQFDMGNAVQFQPLVGLESVEVNGRECTAAVSLDLTAAQAVTWQAEVKANTATGLGFTHGTAAGYITAVHMPVVQRINPSVEDFNGNALHAYQLRVLPSAGNDEVRIVSR